jgi:hypothetical protein
MADEKRFIAIRSGAQLKRFCTVSLQGRDGTVRLVPARLDVSTTFRDQDTTNDAAINQFKISIHATNESTSHNYIKTTQIIADVEDTFMFATRALKSTKRFQPIYSLQVSGLSPERHNLKEKPNLLIACDLKLFTPFCHYCVSPVDLDFSPAFKGLWECYSMVIGDFRIHLVLNYLPIDAPKTNEMCHLITIRPFSEAELPIVYDAGYDEHELGGRLLASQASLARTMVEKRVQHAQSPEAASILYSGILGLGFLNRANPLKLYSNNKEKIAALNRLLTTFSQHAH